MLDGYQIIIENGELWQEDQLAKRLAFFLVGDESQHYLPYKKDNDSWQLDSGNNWFLHNKNNKMILHTRYWNKEELSHLDHVIHLLWIGRRKPNV